MKKYQTRNEAYGLTEDEHGRLSIHGPDGQTDMVPELNTAAAHDLMKDLNDWVEGNLDEEATVYKCESCGEQVEEVEVCLKQFFTCDVTDNEDGTGDVDGVGYNDANDTEVVEICCPHCGHDLSGDDNLSHNW